MSLRIRSNAARNRIESAGYIIVVTLLGLPLVAPLLHWTSSPCTHDGHLHFQRITALNHTWQNGLYFSRWMPDLAFGYGYPFFLYREAAPLYLTLWPHLLGLSLPASLNLFYALSILASGWFMFLWVKDIFGPISGVVSAVAYMAAPYLLIDAFVRGNQPESLALAIFPFLFWAGRRYLVAGRAGYLVLSLAGYVLLALSHNISLLLFTPFLFVYLAFAGWLSGQSYRDIAIRLALVFVLGLGISAFYVGPALFELDQITISQSVSAHNNDFRFNFATVGEMLAPVARADSSLLNPPLLIRLGWVPLLFALVGLVAGLMSPKRSWRWHTLFMGLSAAFLLFMAMALSKTLWEALPLIEFVQFPWRFIGRAALPIAFLAGIPFAALPDLLRNMDLTKRIMPWAAAGAVILLTLESLPNLYPHQCRGELFPTINSVHAYERSSGLVGVDPLGSYFPKSVLARPTGSPLEGDYQAGIDPKRFDESVMPESSRLSEASYSSLSGVISVDGDTPFQAQYFAFDFPGWVVEIDGQPVPITPSNPAGLITFPVPAGRHTIEVDWQMTTTRAIMTAVSLLALAAAAGVVIFLYRNEKGDPSQSDENEVTAEPDLSTESTKNDFSNRRLMVLGIFALAAVVLIAVKFLLVDRLDTPLRNSGEPSIQSAADLVGGGLQLIGFELGSDAVQAGNSFDANLAWLALETPGQELQTNLRLVGPEGHFWSEKEAFRPRTYQRPSPTTFWLPGQWTWDSHQIQVFEGAPPGQYDLVLTLFDRADLQPLTLLDSSGNELGPDTVIGQIEVSESSIFSADTPQYEVNAVAAGLTLLGYNLDREEAASGDQILLTFFWEKIVGGDEPGNQLTINLEDATGVNVHDWKLPPVSDAYPPEKWMSEQILRGQHFIRLPADLDSGEYLLKLEQIPLRTLSIQAPDRTYDEPLSDRKLEHNFEDQIALSGLSIEPADPENNVPISVDLAWQALAEMSASYHVFVHLIDQDGRIVDQSDGIPAEWTRPTTGWVAGEFVVDQHSLFIPEGMDPLDLSLRIGLYNPDTGNRLLINSSEFVVLPLIEAD